MKQPQTITITLTDDPSGKLGLQVEALHELSGETRTNAEIAAEVMLQALSEYTPGMADALKG